MSNDPIRDRINYPHMFNDGYEPSKPKRSAALPLGNCHDCGVSPGNMHLYDCDVERCSVCGSQRLSCGCIGHDRKFARWTGIWPGKAEADYLGLDLNEFEELELPKVFFRKPRNK